MALILAVRSEDRAIFDQEPDSRKDDLLKFMRSYEADAIAPGNVNDYVTNSPVEQYTECAYQAEGLWWDLSDVYNLEHHDVHLNPEFRRRALAIIDGETSR